MKLKLSLFLLLAPLWLHAQTFGPGYWTLIGPTYQGVTPYNRYYYKLVELKNNTDRYETSIEVSIQADPNYFNQQATYRIRVDKHQNTPDRFDGIEITCISGSPSAATFFVYNDAVWVQATFQWGSIYYKTDGSFNASPLVGSPWGQTLTAPTGYLAATSTYGLKCNFDNNTIYKLAYQTSDGNTHIGGRLGIAVNSMVNKLVLPNNESIAWKNPDLSGEPVKITANANNDLSVYAGAADRLYIKSSNGNVGIGTNNPGSYKLAVEGIIGARKVKVTQSAWADDVFEDDYDLPSLNELERFITKNKHLPGVPAEKEILKEGLDLGEMNRVLLAKVEELTLYIIKQQKELDKLAQEVGQLKRR